MDFKIFSFQNFQGLSNFLEKFVLNKYPSSKHMCPDYGLAPRFFLDQAQIFFDTASSD